MTKKQSEEQFGFRSSRSTTDALIIAESLVSKSIEFNVDLWVVSVDLRKAFDRVEHEPLFSALRAQGLDYGYCALLERLYDKQVGVLSDDRRFPISRGVRQGDVLSPLLFNSVLESAIQSWKRKLSSDCGVALVPDAEAERMTNIRFADDLLLFAKSMQEAVQMVDLLVEALREYGLELNMQKTKLMSTTVTDNDTTLIETDHVLLS